ncbi:FAD-dependent oxidoreductase [Candidatus Uhrbacteria bacterium]|nr:FAD-dependent oxidoreductase [Candidatus Uhrbacteria bacterium]
MEDDIRLKEVPFRDIPDITREPRFRVHVVSRTTPTTDTIELVLEKPEGFTFLPGQYIWLVLPKRSSTFGIVDRRTYSICSGIDERSLHLLIRVTQGEYLQAVGNLNADDEVEIIGPMGSAFCVPSQGAVMISGGTGLTPFLSIVKSHLSGGGCFLFLRIIARRDPSTP